MSNLSRHCSNLNKQTNVQKQYDKQNKIIKELKKEVKELRKSKNHGGKIIDRQIQIVAHGKENMDKIDDMDIITALKGGLNVIQKLVEAIYFNDKYPENKNIYISNMSRPYCNVYDGEKWIIADNKDIIPKLYLNMYNLMNKKLFKLYDKLQPYHINELYKFISYNEKDCSFVKKK